MKKILTLLKITALFTLLSASSITLPTLARGGYIYTGGSVGADVDQHGYYLDVSPLIGYRTGIWDIGLSPFYSYTERHDRERYSYGARTFLQATFYRNIYAHAEAQAENLEDSKGERIWAVSFPVGGGYRYRIDRKTTAYGQVTYEINQDKDSYRSNPAFRAGINRRF